MPRSTKRSRTMAALNEWTEQDEELAQIDPDYFEWHHSRQTRIPVIQGEDLTAMLMDELTWTRRALYVVSMALLTLVTVQIKAVLWLVPACIYAVKRLLNTYKEIRYGTQDD